MKATEATQHNHKNSFINISFIASFPPHSIAVCNQIWICLWLKKWQETDVQKREKTSLLRLDSNAELSLVFRIDGGSLHGSVRVQFLIAKCSGRCASHPLSILLKVSALTLASEIYLVH